ncbi:DinB family protein [Aquihabitans sp. McL0605]|uniref:DinB family protein n=1 Tax=Aquihabitans sp. McL0605 TaxID=3415671 RepID=UPI003CF946BC
MKAVSERVGLERTLDWYREGVIAKVQGLPQHLAVATPLRSGSTIAGLVKHLALVEDSWFADDFAGLDPLPWWADVDWDADRDWEFHSALTEPIELQVDRYREACERAREIARGRSLDDVGADHSSGEFTLRFVLLHMIEETARHLGHLDVLRELLDGTTGE